MSSIQDSISAVVAEFTAMPTWEERYQRIIALARDLPPMPEEWKIESNRVRGCSSTVWLHATLEGDRLIFHADSDAVLVRGLAALLVKVYSGQQPTAIMTAPHTFLQDIGLNQNLSPNRASGLTAMVKQIVIYAMAYAVKLRG